NNIGAQNIEDYCNRNVLESGPIGCSGTSCTCGDAAGWTATHSPGQHVAIICNDSWSRRCISGMTTNGTHQTPIMSDGPSPPASSGASSGAGGPIKVADVHSQSFVQAVTIGYQEPTFGVT